MFKQFLKCEVGATAIEYGLIASLIMLGMIVGFGSAADSLQALFGANDQDIQQGLAG